MSCVVDTTVASFILEDRPELSAYRPHLEQSSLVYISFQTVAEMKFGALLRNWGDEKQKKLEKFFSGVQVIDSSIELATKWAIVMHEARLAGRRLETGDAWIAASALLLGIPLLTHDKDFDKSACPSIIVYSYSS